MSSKPKVLMIVTLDTKAVEAAISSEWRSKELEC
jgi:hypothetical protein